MKKRFLSTMLASTFVLGLLWSSFFVTLVAKFF